VPGFQLDGGDRGALLVHGFTGTAEEMRHLGRALHGRGMTVHAVQLAGHGGTLTQLDSTGWPQWLRSVQDGLERLAARCAEVHLVGFSAGGALSLVCAQREPRRIASLALLATPLWLGPGSRAPLRLLRRSGIPAALQRLPTALRDGLLDLASGVLVPAGRARLLRASVSLEQLTGLAYDAAPFVRCPALVLHALRDPVVPYACSAALVRRLPRARRVTLRRGGHVIVDDVARDEVARQVGDFLLPVVA
jgi:carboxylesterase